MKRVLRFLVLLTLIACVVYPVSAESAEMPNWDDYTYEELVEIRTELDAYIQKLEKQYAIEHGNRTIILNESEQTIYRGKTFAFTAEGKKVVEDAPETPGFVWSSSDETIAKVSTNAVVTAVGYGDAVITCTAADGSGSTASCEVTVIQMVNSLRIDTSAATVTVNKNESVTFDAVIAPETATNQKLNWESSDKEVAVVDANGKVTAVGGGVATITCASTDGSEKTASVNIYVPSIAVDAQEYTVTSMDGLSIPFKYYGKQENFSFTPDACMYFSVKLNQSGENMMLNIIPDKAGMATVTLKDKADSRSQVTIKIQVEHSACYDSTSYPTGNYTNIMRSPSSFKGKNMSVYGRILQLQKGWFGSVTLRVATQGRWDNVFYITCSSGDVEGIIEDDYITVYGECDGTETYTTIMGGSVTIPSMNAEKIFLGRH